MMGHKIQDMLIQCAFAGRPCTHTYVHITAIFVHPDDVSTFDEFDQLVLYPTPAILS